MESLDLRAAASRRDNKRRVSDTNRDWHQPLRLRKSAVQPPPMQSRDKRGPKKIAAAAAAAYAQSAPPRGHRGTPDAAPPLRFTCSQCRDDREYVPKDLAQHFEERHRGAAPVFPCRRCTFTTHEFSYLQVHLLSHKDTFSGCGICNDDVARTWSEFNAHLTASHAQNGKYSCETCQKFSTADVAAFLEHVYAHNLGLERASGENKNACQHCGYVAAASARRRRGKAAHVCHNGRKKKKEELNSKTDAVPKPRLTRSAVREMCWLTQDVLSLPGREFLDKYCHLSDPQTTLAETQQFLMKSVAGETGDQKWTKALKSVLSNVPQEMSLKSENGVVTTSAADLTVLTVKNKITVAQNGATYAKRLKLTATSEKEAPESVAVVDRNGRQSPESDRAIAETKLDGTAASQLRDNQESKRDTESEGLKNPAVNEDGITVSGKELAPVHAVIPRTKRRRRGRRRAGARRTVKKLAAAAALKIVLKKNPVKEALWVSQSSDKLRGTASPRTTPEDAAPPILQDAAPPILQDAAPIFQDAAPPILQDAAPPILQDAAPRIPQDAAPPILQDAAPAILQDAAAPILQDAAPIRQDAAAPILQDAATILQDAAPILQDAAPILQDAAPILQDAAPILQDAAPPILLDAAPTDQKALTAAYEDPKAVASCPAEDAVDEVSPPTLQEMRDESPQEEVGGSGCTAAADAAAEAAAEITDRHEPDDGGCVAASAVLHPVITPQANSVDQILAEPSATATTPDPEPPVESSPDPQEPHRRWQLHPKHLERTLKLVAVSPSQPVKRPAGDQPVVVLNHPDADIPEVARIMAVINRYRGEVQKVVLSRRTAIALSAAGAEEPAGRVGNAVQERFLLRLKLRRLSRKKYEVVGAVGAAAAAAGDVGSTTFRCWFCGRAFGCRETWLVHRQRHMMEWEKPNCEK